MDIQSLRSLRLDELAALGAGDIAYVKPVKVEGRTAYALHAADGHELALMANREVAFAALRQNGLEPMSTH